MAVFMRNDERSDADVVAASLLTPEAFSVLVERHFTEIFGYLSRRVGSDSADDLGAATFEAAFRGRRTYSTDRGSVLAWLYGIATNQVRHHRRAEVRRLKAMARLEPADGAGIDNTEGVAASVDAAILLTQVAAALARIGRTHRDVLLLVAVQGMSHDDAAAALGISGGTLRSRLSRARAELRHHLAAASNNEPSSHPDSQLSQVPTSRPAKGEHRD